MKYKKGRYLPDCLSYQRSVSVLSRDKEASLLGIGFAAVFSFRLFIDLPHDLASDLAAKNDLMSFVLTAFCAELVSSASSSSHSL